MDTSREHNIFKQLGLETSLVEDPIPKIWCWCLTEDNSEGDNQDKDNNNKDNHHEEDHAEGGTGFYPYMSIFFNKLAPRTVQFINLGSTDYPAFFLQGGQFLKLVIRQCLSVKGFRVEIVSVVLCIGCSFTKKNVHV